MVTSGFGGGVEVGVVLEAGIQGGQEGSWFRLVLGKGLNVRWILQSQTQLDRFGIGRPTEKTNDFSFIQEILLNHTFNGDQITWFKAGSALNHMKVTLSRSVKYMLVPSSFDDCTLTANSLYFQAEMAAAAAN